MDRYSACLYINRYSVLAYLWRGGILPSIKRFAGSRFALPFLPRAGPSVESSYGRDAGRGCEETVGLVTIFTESV
jgi:hypothetical protein